MRSWGGRRKNETNDIYKRAELSKETRWRGRITPIGILWCLSVEMSVSKLHVWLNLGDGLVGGG